MRWVSDALILLTELVLWCVLHIMQHGSHSVVLLNPLDLLTISGYGHFWYEWWCWIVYLQTVSVGELCNIYLDLQFYVRFVRVPEALYHGHPETYYIICDVGVERCQWGKSKSFKLCLHTSGFDIGIIKHGRNCSWGHFWSHTRLIRLFLN